MVSGASSASWERFAAPRLTCFTHFVKQLAVGRHHPPPPPPQLAMTMTTTISVRLRRKENAAGRVEAQRPTETPINRSVTKRHLAVHLFITPPRFINQSFRNLFSYIYAFVWKSIARYCLLLANLSINNYNQFISLSQSISQSSVEFIHKRRLRLGY